MAVTKARVASELLESEATSAGDPAADAAVTALLDHLAEELAQEYVRLMEKAARDERIDGDVSRQEVGMLAAIYARYSSENQRPESIEDQVAACRRLAGQRGFTIVE